MLRLAAVALAGVALARGRLRPRPARAAVCPERIPDYDYTLTTNGCGPEGGVNVPGRIWGADFASACNGHDVCYGTCNRKKKYCDDEFHLDLRAACAAQGWATYLLTNCTEIAGVYYSAVALGGGDAYAKAQNDACECCTEGDACGPNSAGYECCCQKGRPFCCDQKCCEQEPKKYGAYCCPAKTTSCGPVEKCCVEGFECRTDCASGGYACQRIGSGPC